MCERLCGESDEELWSGTRVSIKLPEGGKTNISDQYGCTNTFAHVERALAKDECLFHVYFHVYFVFLPVCGRTQHGGELCNNESEITSDRHDRDADHRW